MEELYNLYQKRIGLTLQELLESMRSIIDSAIIGAYIVAAFAGGNFALKKAHDKIQKMALEKAATGLGSMEKIARGMTGKRLNF